MIPENVYIIVPVYNEASVLDDVLKDLLSLYRHVVVVDDASNDGSGDIAKSLGATVLRHACNLGQGAAIQTGLDYCLANGAEYLVTFDGDAQHQAEDLEQLLEPLVSKKVDYVLGSRFLGSTEDMPLSRRILLTLALAFTRATSGLPLTDTHNGLRGFSAKGARAINITFNRMAHASQLLEQIAESGLPYQELPVKIKYTSYSLAKGQRNRDSLTVLWEYITGKLIK
jgi:glycosyltransferase involved in cell wall biosynthesis